MNEFSWSQVEVKNHQITLRNPSARDGVAVNALVQSCPPLDTNSVYCNILQCDAFADTGVVAECSGEIIGFVSAFLWPSRTTTLFVWQIVVAPQMRGLGIAEKLLDELSLRPACRMVTHIEATINPDNTASWRLFERLAERLHTQVERSKLYDSAQHFGNQYADEISIKIGPIATPDHAIYSNQEDQ